MQWKLLILFLITTSITSAQLVEDIENAVRKIPEDIVSGIDRLTNKVVNGQLSEDGLLNFTELAMKYGYTCEEHDVVTEDGYILKLFHIPGNSSKIVLLNHGILDSADTYVLRQNQSLALALAASNYDVWAMNCRGTRYSRNHIKLDPDTDDEKFFNFSFHEIGVYDIPAVIDFILNITDTDTLHYIGHSQGTTALLVTASERPEYNEKIKTASLLAPVAYVSHIRGLIGLVKLIAEPIIALGNALDIQEFAGYNSSLTRTVRFFCTQNLINGELCLAVAFVASGYDPKRLDQKFLKILLGHYPAGTSFKSLAHYGQMDKEFRQYDYGKKNVDHYGTETPPNYDLSKVTTKIALFCGKNDFIADLRDIAKLRPQLPNVKYHVMKQTEWNHNDFIWSPYSGTELTPLIIDIIENVNDS